MFIQNLNDSPNGKGDHKLHVAKERKGNECSKETIFSVRSSRPSIITGWAMADGLRLLVTEH